MLLHQQFQQILGRYKPGSPAVPANRFIFGFVIPHGEQLSIIFGNGGARLEDGVREAEYLVYGTLPLFAALLNPDMPDRASIVGQLRIQPDYPFSNYLLSIFLNAFDLAILDLDYVAKRFDGPFPFPPRYPVADNTFRMREYQSEPIPAYDPQRLPELIADDHPTWVAMFNRAWELAFRNLRQPEPDSGFITNFIDPAFNANIFLWDSCFMTMFGRYARRQFYFMGTLDNFYAKQHDDGFICREINTYSGKDLFQSLDPRSTGPNILAWTEWHDYQLSRDEERLCTVFSVLIGYHRWWKEWRTHSDGGYWTSGWGSGMDNQTRIPRSEYHHRHFSWIDTNMQQALNCQMLLKIGAVIGRSEFDAELKTEFFHLGEYINARMWDEDIGFYFDAASDGTLSRTKSIGAYWGLHSGIIPDERAKRMIAHLDDPAAFNRPHRIPTQSGDSEVYNPYGGYWLGAVWSPTNYMVLRGLTERGRHNLAYVIAQNHIENVGRVFEDTGTLWENYAPEHALPGKPAGRDFVGWTGVSAITIPLEYLIGVRPISQPNSLLWDIRLTERHGIQRYPLGISNEIDLVCGRRIDSSTRPTLNVKTHQPVMLEVRWDDHHKEFSLEAGEHLIQC